MTIRKTLQFTGENYDIISETLGPGIEIKIDDKTKCKIIYKYKNRVNELTIKKNDYIVKMTDAGNDVYYMSVPEQTFFSNIKYLKNYERK